MQQYQLGKGKVIMGNSAGMRELVRILKPFVHYQAIYLNFPSMSKEDIEQELYKYAFEALPQYNPNKNANLVTFLQNVMKNRAINLCKFFSEKRRNANYLNKNEIKARCNSCRSFFRTQKDAITVECPSCHTRAPSDSQMWKWYNIAEVPSQFGVPAADGHIMGPEIEDENISFSGFSENMDLDRRIELNKFKESLDSANKSIINLLCEGYSVTDISIKLGIGSAEVLKRIRQMTKEFGAN